MEEIWKDIPDYEGFYKISNTGKIRSVDHKRKCFDSFYVMKGRELIPSFGSSGYLQVGLSKLGKTKIFMIHRLVAKVFVENNDSKNNIAVNHIDGNKTNNYASNLEWVTYSENQKHAYKNGLNRWSPGKGKPMKSVIQLDKTTNEIVAIHNSIGDAKRAVCAKSSSSISRCCKDTNKHRIAYGFKWIYKDEYEKSIESEE